MLALLNRFEMLLQKALMAVAAFFLLAMMAMTCADILCRKVWKPLPGVFELMGYFGALVVACALGYTQRKRDHIAIDILTNCFPLRIRKILDVFNRLACMIFSLLAAREIGKLAHNLMTTGEVSETLRLPYYPFAYGVAAGFVLLAFVFFVELLKTYQPAEKDNSEVQI
jgi:TRAP-type C4-dicarboxylate transport system permease small subunit